MNPLDEIHDQRNMPEDYDPKEHLHPRLRFRLTIYFVIAIVLVAVVIYYIISDRVSTFYPLVALAIGIILGIFMSRMFHITWDHGAKKAISRFDTYGLVILVFYIFFEVYREEIVGYFIHGQALVATSFAIFAGTMIGRLIGMRQKVKQVVIENL